MRTTFEINGFPEAVLERAVKTGIARSKTDAIRLSIHFLNDKYDLIKDINDLENQEMVTEFKKQEVKMQNQGKKYLTNKEVLAKYKHLID
jgi:Arc/MetJ-type ribon-helix-helix transcriptional regulator